MTQSNPVEPRQAPEVTGLGASAEVAAEGAHAAEVEPRISQPKLGNGYLALLILSYFALYLAWITPVGFSLAIRVAQLDPIGKDSALALAVGIPALVVLVTGPLVGVLSDRTRFRFGRRRTWMAIGMVAGLVGSVLVGLAPNIPLMIAAWTLAWVGYTAAGAMFLTHLGDRLPEKQRGKVAGFTGAVTQIAPIFGIVIAGGFASMPVAMFAIPALVAFLIGLIFLFVMKDAPATGPIPPVDVKSLLQGFWFNPRRHPNFAWVWISRALIFLALSFMSIYTVYLLGSRLHLASGAIAGLVAAQGGLGVVLAILGSILSGTLSDKLGRRKPFIVIAGFMLAAGLIITGTLTSVPQFFIGGLIGTLGVGMFGAIDQAIGLDTLPTDQGQNGRFMGIFNLANQAAQAVGPFLAGGIAVLAGGNYTWVYAAAALFAVAGGLLILPVRPERPTTVSIPAVKL